MSRRRPDYPVATGAVEYAGPGSDAYVHATSPHNSSGSQHPALVAVPRSIQGVADVISYAARNGLRVRPQATGHGAAGEVRDDTIIVDTSGLAEVDIDPGTRTARAGAGATWAAVNATAERHGLLGRAGSAPGVSVSGYTFGGGVGWLARASGMASAALRAVDYVDGSGTIRRATDDADDLADREALWAFRGGGGVGIAARLEFGLAAVGDLWAGYLLWPAEHLDAVVAAWAAALPRIGPALATSISVLHAPPFPPFPQPLRGTPVVHLALASPDGADHASALREALASVPPAAVDTWGPADAERLAGIHLDPPAAVPALGAGRWLGPGTPAIAADILSAAAASASPLSMVELRNVDSSAPMAAGAVTAAPGPFLLHAVGLAATPEAREPLERTLTDVGRSSAPADIGRSAVSFAEGRPGGADSLVPADRVRLASITAELDPGGVIAASRFLLDRDGTPSAATAATSAREEPSDRLLAPDADEPAAGQARRRRRRDAEANRERVLTAAASAMLREGRNVPLAIIAAEAGVGVATLYRSHADRQALLHALEHRAYGLLNQILDEIDRTDLPGLDAVAEFLSRTLAIGDQLVLPLHGAPPLMSAEAVEARQAINRRLDRFIDRGHADHSIRAAVNATDVIVFSAVITQPLPHGPDWPRIARRQLAIFVNGLAWSGPIDLPGPGVRQEDIENAFALRASPGPADLAGPPGA
jgi:AcrR family transcriptional regulator